MSYGKALAALALLATLTACGQQQGEGSTVQPSAVPTSPNAAAQTTGPEGPTSEAATAVTQVANEEITTSPETITVVPADQATAVP